LDPIFYSWNVNFESLKYLWGRHYWKLEIWFGWWVCDRSKNSERKARHISKHKEAECGRERTARSYQLVAAAPVWPRQFWQKEE
jgi:hypothetical protein